MLPFLAIIFTFQQSLSGGKVLNQGSDSNGGNVRPFGGGRYLEKGRGSLAFQFNSANIS